MPLPLKGLIIGLWVGVHPEKCVAKCAALVRVAKKYPAKVAFTILSSEHFRLAAVLWSNNRR